MEGNMVPGTFFPASFRLSILFLRADIALSRGSTRRTGRSYKAQQGVK